MRVYLELLRADLRLCMLRVLTGAASYTSNESILTRMANQLGVTSTRDQVRTELAWLEEQGFLRTETIEGLLIATVSERGVEIAEGRASHPQISRPGPKKA